MRPLVLRLPNLEMFHFSSFNCQVRTTYSASSSLWRSINCLEKLNSKDITLCDCSRVLLRLRNSLRLNHSLICVSYRLSCHQRQSLDVSNKRLLPQHVLKPITGVLPYRPASSRTLRITEKIRRRNASVGFYSPRHKFSS